MMPTPTTQVWDPFVRIGHWLLVIAFAVAFLTEEEMLGVHVWAGYVVAVYVVARVVWGFIGSQHARFSDFLFSPFKGLSYLVDLMRMRAPRYLGHSPAGAMMVFALLFALTGTVVTGMAQLALSRGEGPLSPFVEQQVRPTQPSDVTTAVATENDQDRREEESLTKEAHELFANLTLILIGFHIAGVVLASVAHKESLVLAMITGRKAAKSPSGKPL